MVIIDELEYPDVLMTVKEMARSLKIGVGYLRKLEDEGLPYYLVGNTLHRYDPVEVWKWYRARLKHVGGTKPTQE